MEPPDPGGESSSEVFKSFPFPDDHGCEADGETSPAFLLRRRRRRSDTQSPHPSAGIQVSDTISAARGRRSSSALTSVDDRTRRDEGSIAEPQPPPPPPETLLDSVAGLVIKATLFQINLFVSAVTLPIWLLRGSFSLLADPFSAPRRILSWVLNVSQARVSPLVSSRFGTQQGWLKLVARSAWGCIWSFYVCSVLLGLLATAFFAASLAMRWVVEEPVQMAEDLNFDYTKATPDAFVPLASCDGSCFNCTLYRRPVPLNHKLQVTTSLMLPESDYNRKLGMFQVRVEFLAANGKVTSSSSQPCMLRFKSSHVRVMESFLKSGTLLTGYSSESQILRIKMRGFTEAIEATTCIRVILEQRAEYRYGAGIPEIYSASLELESELPLFKRIVWSWRRTAFIWVSTSLFTWELLVVFVCCRPVIVPRARLSRAPPSST